MKKRYLAAGFGVGAVGGLVAWKILSRADEVRWDDVKEFVRHSEHSHFTEIDGIRIHYQEFGEAHNPTLLLIHGYTASTYTWKSCAPMLAEKGFHVVALDLVGFGYSGKPSWFEYSIQSQARIVSRFMNRLGIGRATVIGSSYGGAIASVLALDYAERVEKVVLVDAVINDEPKSHPVLRLASMPYLGEAVAAFFTDSPRYSRRRMRNTLWKDNYHLIDDERVASVTRPLKAADAHRSVLQTARKWNAAHIETDAQFINQPTLIIWGEYDNVIPIRNGYKLHEAILNSRFIVFKNCGHVPQEENPEGFTEAVSNFVRDRKGKLNFEENEKMRLEV